MTNHVRWFQDLTSKDTHEVGAKNASLGEMIASLQEDNIHVPAGFATTVEAYREFVSDNELKQTIRDGIDVQNF